jgi:hypothetical protein
MRNIVKSVYVTQNESVTWQSKNNFYKSATKSNLVFCV